MISRNNHLLNNMVRLTLLPIVLNDPPADPVDREVRAPVSAAAFKGFG